MSNRFKRKEVAANTLDIIENGFYLISSDVGKEECKTVSIKDSSLKCDDNTKILDINDWEMLFEEHKGPLQLVGPDTSYEVTPEMSISCCQRLNREGYKNITCLNFASAKNPCGGMFKGSIAQEESLGLCSALYSSLSKQENHYETNKKDPKNGLYQDSLIYSPACTVFRNDITYNLLPSPFNVNFISCPAVNFSIAKVPNIIVKETMKRRAKAILSVAADDGCDAIVLGAWGTGVFKNDIKDVAEYFKECLMTDSKESSTVKEVDSCVKLRHNSSIQKVVFAVGPDEKKQKAFKNILDLK